MEDDKLLSSYMNDITFVRHCVTPFPHAETIVCFVISEFSARLRGIAFQISALTGLYIGLSSELCLKHCHVSFYSGITVFDALF